MTEQLRDITQLMLDLLEDQLAEGKFNKDLAMQVHNYSQFFVPKQATTNAQPGEEGEEEISITYGTD